MNDASSLISIALLACTRWNAHLNGKWYCVVVVAQYAKDYLYHIKFDNNDEQDYEGDDYSSLASPLTAQAINLTFAMQAMILHWLHENISAKPPAYHPLGLQQECDSMSPAVLSSAAEPREHPS